MFLSATCGSTVVQLSVKHICTFCPLNFPIMVRHVPSTSEMNNVFGYQEQCVVQCPVHTQLASSTIVYVGEEIFVVIKILTAVKTVVMTWKREGTNAIQS